MSDDQRLTEALHESLHRRADAFDAQPSEMADVLRRARTIRRRRRTAVTAVAAAAVAALLVPTALALGTGPQAGPTVPPVATRSASPTVIATPQPTLSPAPPLTPTPTRTTTPTPTPTQPSTPPSTPATTPAPSSPTAQQLAGLPMGSPLDVTYLHDGTVHLFGGGRPRLPGIAKGVSAFTPYHGGWLIVDDGANTIVEYDNTGKVVRSGDNGRLAVSLDGTQTAFQIGSTIHVGIASGMGDVEQQVPAPRGGLVGLVGSGVVYNSANSVMLADYAGKVRPVRGLSFADSTYWQGDLVGGMVGNTLGPVVHGGVVSAKTGKVVWQNGWRPVAFSLDGKYVAAVPAGDNGDSSAVAILDAKTGTVVARQPLVGNRLYLNGPVVFDQHDTALFNVDEGLSRRTAVLRLSPTGGVTRATPVVVRPAGTTPAYVFATQP